MEKIIQMVKKPAEGKFTMSPERQRRRDVFAISVAAQRGTSLLSLSLIFCLF
ncbi:MAG: hypothetical protein BROFUL_02912 [Candidatus Brocadia fulgida]|jgi:hypothetical protein|uniref:Uncharacterized protein n=1 Tax=Candidatus Brocadia fulgida TaxID=380242 RepID=A0A0M2UTU4_9BACT|nr:MAG: hypothetical protein BROFUL_02912 [Candidatus Brocadia fulgida]MBV6518306.1 hypothetical protein [Candidatus Brocadia fulgida]